jgi:hypothetical protein
MREYIVWNESGDLLSGPHRKRETAERMEAKFRSECAAFHCGNDNPGNGDFPEYNTTCGVLSPHGIHIQVTEDGYDITGHDY